ncbi:MAG: sensor histidine kinase [Actinobacteria bacterium]|nr:sensor histidine kinase [Actinomycetota bacterium]
MRMQTRLSLAATGVIAIVAISIGSASVINHYNAGVKSIDGQLQSAISTVTASERDPITAVLEYTNYSQIPLSVSYVSADGQVAALSGNRNLITTSPSTKFLKSSSSQAQDLVATEHLRVKSLYIGDKEYLIFVSSLEPVIAERSTEIRILIIAVVIFVSIGVLILSMFIHSDISKLQRLIQSATEIAKGETEISLPAPTGKSEVDELTTALDTMIGTLQRTVEAERAVQKSMQNFLGDASHELRTPLTVIKSYVELISPGNKLSPEQTDRAHTRVKSQIERMESLIGDLLLLAELGERKEHPKGTVNLSIAVQQGIDDLYTLQPSRKIEFEVQPNVQIFASQHLVDQLLANTFSNIERHTPADSPVEISLISNGETATLTIEDAGVGLPSDVYQHGITHFQRFDPSRSRETGGSGLGMSIMAAIVEENGGNIELFPSKFSGLGTRFTFPVPVNNSAEFADGPQLSVAKSLLDGTEKPIASIS